MWANLEEQPASTQTPRTHKVKMQWIEVRWGEKMSRHSVTNTRQIPNTLSEEQPTEKLDGPIFCGSRKNRENTKKKKLDMVRVRWPSSSRTCRVSCFLDTFHRAAQSQKLTPFRPALKTHLFCFCFCLNPFQKRERKTFIAAVPNSHRELCYAI